MSISPEPKLNLKEMKARSIARMAKIEQEESLLFGSQEDVEQQPGISDSNDGTTSHAQPDSPSNNPSLGASLPTAPPAELPDIPTTPSGIIDTFIAELDAPVHSRDVKRLRKLDEFTITERGAGKRQKPGQGVQDLKALVTLWRASDGCRITCFTNRTRVEVSSPRVLGYSNHRQAWMSEADVLEAFRSVTSKILPTTTVRARWVMKTDWHIERIDLAKNFLGRASEVIESMRFAKHPAIRAKATVSGQDGLALYGTNLEICLYDRDAKMGRGRLSKSVRGRASANKAERDLQGLSRLRFETRFMTDVGIDRLTRHLVPSPTGLPFMISRGDGTRHVVRLGFTNHLLHQILANEARALGSVTVTQAEGAKSWKGLGLLGRLYLVEHPDAWTHMKASYGERSLRAFEQDVAALKVSRRYKDFVEMIWSAPQVTPQLRVLIAGERQRMRSQRFAS